MELVLTVVVGVSGMQVHKYSTTILSAMMSGMDDRDDPMDLITLESMSGLSKIISQIEEGHVRAILINIALRIRPCFEKVSCLLRYSPGWNVFQKAEGTQSVITRSIAPSRLPFAKADFCSNCGCCFSPLSLLITFFTCAFVVI